MARLGRANSASTQRQPRANQVVGKPSGVANLPTGIKMSINKALTSYVSGKTFNEADSQRVGRLIQMTNPVSLAPGKSPEESAADRKRYEMSRIQRQPGELVSQQIKESPLGKFLTSKNPLLPSPYAPGESPELKTFKDVAVGAALAPFEALESGFAGAKAAITGDIPVKREFSRQPDKAGIPSDVYSGLEAKKPGYFNLRKPKDREAIQGEGLGYEKPSRLDLFKQGAVQESKLLGGEGVIYGDPETDAAMRLILPFAIDAVPLAKFVVGKANKLATTKKELIPGSEIKKALDQLTTGRDLKAKKLALDEAQKLINLNGSIEKFTEAIKGGVKVTVKRDFIQVFKDLFTMTPKEAPEIRGFLQELNSVNLDKIPEKALNEYYGKAMEIFKKRKNSFNESRAISLKGADDAADRPGIELPAPLPKTDDAVPPAPKPEENVSPVNRAKAVIESSTPPQTIKAIEDAEKLIPGIPKGFAQNKQAERFLQSDKIPEDLKVMIRDHPSSYHEIIPDQYAEDYVKSLGEPELREVLYSDLNKISTYAGQRLIEKYQDEGRPLDEILNVVAETNKISSKAGQNLQAQKVIAQYLRPETKVLIFEQELNKTNRKLTPPQKEELYKGYKEAKDVGNELDKQGQEVLVNFSKANVTKHKKLLEKQDEVLRRVSKLESSLAPPSWSKLGIALMQGNLLTPLSLMRNIAFNIFYMPYHLSARSTSAMLDTIRAKVTKTPRKEAFGDVSAFGKGLGTGFKEAVKTLRVGARPDDLGQLDGTRALQPVRSMIQAFSGKGLPVDIRTGKVKLEDRLIKLTEGVFGAPAEALFRGLALGDLPFRAAERAREVSAQAFLKGLKGEEKKAFSIVQDIKSLEVIEKRAAEAVAQQENLLTESLGSIGKILERNISSKRLLGFTRFMSRAVISPYVKTPSNLISLYILYTNPGIAMTKGLYHAYKGQSTAATYAFGVAAVGAATGLAAAFLVDNELVNGDVYENAKKDKLAKVANIPPGHINISGLQRILGGGDGKFRNGDTVVDYRPLGIMGAQLEINFAEKYVQETAEERRKNKKIEQKFGKDLIINETADAMKGVFLSAGYALNQSFLQGTNVLLNGLTKIDTAQGQSHYEKLLGNVFSTVSATVLPNTLNAIGRVDDNTMRDVKGEDVSEVLTNTLRNRLFQSKDLDPQLDIYGEPMERIPGKPDLMKKAIFNFLDPFQTKRIKTDASYLTVKNVAAQLNDDSIIPPQIQRGTLSKEDWLKKQISVGRERKALMDSAVASPWFDRLSLEQKGAVIKDINSEGLRVGNEVFTNAPVINESKILAKWEIANADPQLSRSSLGGVLSFMGEDINESGEATAYQWRDYNSKLFALQGGNPDDPYFKETLDIVKKVKDTKTRRTLVKGLYEGGEINQLEYAYLLTQL